MKHYSMLTTDYLDSLVIPIVKDGRTKCEYLNIESAFDIETTSTIYNGEKSAFMYVWMFGIGYGNDVFYGRTWEEFLSLCELLGAYFDLHENKRLITYVHNLGYEFQFMRKFFNWDGVFSIDERKPIKALCDMGIEFRCSYILSGYSLASLAKNLTTHKVKKMEGDLDYELIHHHETELTEKEWGYCENDIVVVNAYINEQIAQYKLITKIPLTNTGRVREYVKNQCYRIISEDGTPERTPEAKRKYSKYRKMIQDLTITVEEYERLKRAFMGGFTHSNPYHTNKVLENVGSVDLTSSYPTVMLSEKYPMSKGRPIAIKSMSDLKAHMKKYCLLMDIRIEGLRNKLGYESYISSSKCSKVENAVENNGRVFSADLIESTIVDIDLQIIEAVYEWDAIYVSKVVGFAKNYLPKPIIESILNMYEDKTTLKGVEGKEVEYLLSKGMLNSVYGMCVTDPVKDEHTYNTEWDLEKVDVMEAIHKYNESKGRFLFYPWGIWVTAYARRNLWSAILNVGNDYIYSDTDSIKALNFETHQPYIDAYNKDITFKLFKMMDYHQLNPSRLSPKTIKGEIKPLGVWEFEGIYSMFKTLGAKRYLVRENGHNKLTVAGLSKKNGLDYIESQCGGDANKVFNMFDDSLYIPADATGKMTHSYIDDEQELLIVDYNGIPARVISPSAIHLDKCDFTLSMSEKYSYFLKCYESGEFNRGNKRL